VSVCLSVLSTRNEIEEPATDTREGEKKEKKKRNRNKNKTKKIKHTTNTNFFLQWSNALSFFLSFFLSFETSSSSVLLPLRADGWFDLQYLIQSQQIKATKDFCLCVCVCVSLSLTHTHSFFFFSSFEAESNPSKTKE
jgi:hypothetical protein